MYRRYSPLNGKVKFRAKRTGEELTARKILFAAAMFPGRSTTPATPLPGGVVSGVAEGSLLFGAGTEGFGFGAYAGQKAAQSQAAEGLAEGLAAVGSRGTACNGGKSPNGGAHNRKRR